MPEPAVLRHHAHLLPERRAPHRARVHVGRGRHAGAVAAAVGRRRDVPHRHRRARHQDPTGGRGAGASRPRRWSTARARSSGRSRRCSTSPTPTSSAPPSRATCGRCRSSSRSSTTTATSSSAPTRGSTASPARRITPRTSWSSGKCPIHGRPVERVTEENWFFKLSRYEQRLLDHYAAHPDAVQPTTRRNEVLGFIKQGLADFSMSRKSVSWGIPLPWDPEQTCYVWFDALFNYCTAAGYGTDPERFARYWPRRLPPHRQGHPAVPRGVLARDADGRGSSAARSACSRTGGCSSAARRCRRRRSTRSRRRSSSTSSASTASATTSCATSTSGPTATSATRRWSRATTPTSPTTSATSRTAC